VERISLQPKTPSLNCREVEPLSHSRGAKRKRHQRNARPSKKRVTDSLLQTCQALYMPQEAETCGGQELGVFSFSVERLNRHVNMQGTRMKEPVRRSVLQYHNQRENKCSPRIASQSRRRSIHFIAFVPDANPGRGFSIALPSSPFAGSAGNRKDSPKIKTTRQEERAPGD